MTWTKEQEAAINTRGCSLLVAAAAGAGKTAVLVERIIRRLMDPDSPVDIDRMLVVTYTNAAASEMRERIADAISSELEKTPDSSLLQRQIALIGKATITTMHSFCLEVIRNNFQNIDLDPVFRIADSTECILLKQEVLEELFDSKYEEDSNEEFLKLVECYGGSRDDSGLRDMVLKLYEFSCSTPYPNEWLFNTAQKFNVDDDFSFTASEWACVILDDLKIEVSGLIDSMMRAVSIVEGLDEFEGYYIHLKNELDELKQLRTVLDRSWDEAVLKFSSFEFDSLPRLKKDADESVKKNASRIRDDVKERIRIIRDELLSMDSKKVSDEIKRLYPSMKALASLAAEFGERFRNKKREKGVLDFSDIEHYAIELLTKPGSGAIEPSPVALSYRERFEEVLVDEYQDSNMVQELIISMVSMKGFESSNLFMVGDVKQSIYRFRQAKPELFLEKYNTYKDTGMERLLLLYKNFRSRAEILDATNFIFKSIMSKNIGELEYGDNEKLNCGAEYPPPDDKNEGELYGGPVELYIMETAKVESKEMDDDRGEEEDLSSIQCEARMVAERIRRLIYEEGYMVTYRTKKADGNEEIGYRPAVFRDIVILMRAVSQAASVFAEELAKLGIPVYSDTGSGYFQAIEVSTMISLLEIIDNPMQDIPLIAVLRSPIASFTPEELIEIRLCDNKKTFFEALKLMAQKGDDCISIKSREFLKRLSMWRKKSKYMPISEFIWYLYTDTGYYAYAGAMPGGIKRQANLRILFERAKEYEEISFKGLFNFINFINRLKDSSGDMSEARTLGENENVVRIMSIHKSKGLEFPIVFVSCLGKSFNVQDLNSMVLFHHNLGFGPEYVDAERRLSYTTIVKQALRKKIRLENFSEEMRILYVAMTRAREKLVMTGRTADVKKAFDRWSEGVNFPGNKIPEYQTLKGRCYLDWICPALIKHEKHSKFRERGGIVISPSAFVEDLSSWELNIYTRNDIEPLQRNVQEDSAAGSEPAGGEYSKEVKRRLEYRYPYMKSSMIHAKLTVTELKKMFGSSLDDDYTDHIFIPEIVKKPVFLEGEGKLSAAEKGTAMHLVMQHVSMDKQPSADEIRLLLDNMTMEEFMTSEQKSSIEIRKVVKFFESPIGLRLLKSRNVRREVPFYMEVKASEIYNDIKEDVYKGENIILQGVIDCYFEEDDGIVLIDYKTDHLIEFNADIIRERYRIQMEYYTRALEKLTGKHVKERYIYLFDNCELIDI